MGDAKLLRFTAFAFNIVALLIAVTGNGEMKDIVPASVLFILAGIYFSAAKIIVAIHASKGE